MENLVSLAISLAYILLVLGLATLVAHIQGGRSEYSRKLVHVMVGNWVFITPFFTSLWAVALVPLTFIVVNALSIRFHFFKAMGREHENLGTVYYAFSMFVLSSAAFLLGWRELAFIGLLTMAYGDGFASLVGRRWGKHHPFSFAREKSLEGSVTVAITAFIVSLACVALVRELHDETKTMNRAWEFGMSASFAIFVTESVLIALATAIFAAFVELTGKNGCDNLSVPICTGVFASLLLRYGSVGMTVYLLVALGILIYAYQKSAITADGIVAAELTAATLYAFSSIWVAASLLLFFIAGSLVSKISNSTKKRGECRQGDAGARNWKQVLCNSLPACVALWLAHFSHNTNTAALICFSVFAAACADTFSSEIGMLSRGKVLNLINMRPVPNGTSGGVTLLGIAAGMAGSALLAIPSAGQYGIRGFLFVLVLGFFGTLIDSALGSTIQQRFADKHGQLMDAPAYPRQRAVVGIAYASNNVVNMLSLILICIFAYFLKGLVVP
ncbi:MAG: DUF92 domain-containing protein [Bifidobacterium aquikefiri]|uniref:Phosphatidate cytidylyltransferase n=1 Tax=Bifidobacterium aquikefiri TaxID=1653207 RepID=A0A261G6Y1_9BIFI|nr:DUF92 domain-containing protein [Bifidobacterium aquikefiri]OZG67207.1 phosphatidate cytidylyltransferase [Bifidobacterium aquikefiri]